MYLKKVLFYVLDYIAFDKKIPHVGYITLIANVIFVHNKRNLSSKNLSCEGLTANNGCFCT